MGRVGGGLTIYDSPWYDIQMSLEHSTGVFGWAGKICCICLSGTDIDEHVQRDTL
jgi:hypothetical protein